MKYIIEYNSYKRKMNINKNRWTRPEPVVGRRRRCSVSSLSSDGGAAGIDNNFI